MSSNVSTVQNFSLSRRRLPSSKRNEQIYHLANHVTKWIDSNINNRIGGWLEGSFLGVSAFEEREICWRRRRRYWQHNTVVLGKPDKFWPVLFKGAISVVEFLFYILSQLNDLCMVLQYGENEILTDVRPEHFIVRAETDKEKNIE